MIWSESLQETREVILWGTTVAHEHLYIAPLFNSDLQLLTKCSDYTDSQRYAANTHSDEFLLDIHCETQKYVHARKHTRNQTDAHTHTHTHYFGMFHVKNVIDSVTIKHLSNVSMCMF